MYAATNSTISPNVISSGSKPLSPTDRSELGLKHSKFFRNFSPARIFDSRVWVSSQVAT